MSSAQTRVQFFVFFLLAATNCNFRLPLAFPDHIHIGARYIIPSPKKISMEYVVYSEKLEAVVAEGESLLLYYDYDLGRSCEIPSEILDRIQSSEHGADYL